MPGKVGVLFVQSQAGFGADTAIHAHIMRHLDREKFVVHVACTSGDGRGVPDSLQVIRQIPDIRLRLTSFAPGFGQRTAREILEKLPSMAAFPADFVALRKYVAREGIRIVHGTERPRDAVYGVTLAKLTGARSVVHVHVKWSKEYSAAARWGVKRADAVFGISRYVAETVVGMGKPSDAVYTVLNAIEASNWDPGLDGSAVRREFSISPDTLVLASVSRLFSWKGQRELVQAFAAVRAKIPNVRLLIVGPDEPHVNGGSFREELKALAGTLGVADAIVFTGPRSDVPAIMAACDVYSMPSFEEPFGLVFLEAMAMQKPVVAVDNGGTPEVVEHGRSGLLSPPWDVPALTANIVQLLEDRELRARMGQYGRSQVLARFDAKRMARDAGAAYEKILEQ